jgi:trehalose-6-phosphatase
VLSELAPGAAVAYLGDDRTDEDAFAALAGRGLAVLVRDRDRPTEADIRLRPPDEVVAFLSRWVRETRGAPDVPPDERGDAT